MIRHARVALVLVACCVTGCAGADEQTSVPSATAVGTAPTDPSTTPASEVPAPSTSTSPVAAAPSTDGVVVSTVPASTAPADIEPSGVVASSGCNGPLPAATSIDVPSGGNDRTALLALPADLSVPAPLVIDLHGLGADAAQQAAYSGLATRGPAAGVVVATPESASGPFWVLPVRPGTPDVVFVRDLIMQIGAQYCIDTARVVVTGISNGGGLAAGVGCELADIVTAVVPVAGVNIATPCDGATTGSTSIVAFHGVDDPIIPYAGGAPFAGADRSDAAGASAGGRALASMSLDTVEETMSVWAIANGCSDASDTPIGDDVVHRVWTGCRTGRVVELYSVLGGGHTWPGGTPVPTLGATTATVDATQIVLDLVTSTSRS